MTGATGRRVHPHLASAHAYWRLAAKATKAGDEQQAAAYQRRADSLYRRYQQRVTHPPQAQLRPPVVPWAQRRISHVCPPCGTCHEPPRVAGDGTAVLRHLRWCPERCDHPGECGGWPQPGCECTCPGCVAAHRPQDAPLAARVVLEFDRVMADWGYGPQQAPLATAADARRVIAARAGSLA